MAETTRSRFVASPCLRTRAVISFLLLCNKTTNTKLMFRPFRAGSKELVGHGVDRKASCALEDGAVDVKCDGCCLCLDFDAV